MTIKLRHAKTNFEKAAKHFGDADHAINLVAAGLADLTAVINQLQEDVEQIKMAMFKRSGR